MKKLLIILICLIPLIGMSQGFKGTGTLGIPYNIKIDTSKIDTLKKTNCHLTDRDKFEVLIHKKSHKGHYKTKQWVNNGCLIMDIYLVNGKETSKVNFDKTKP